MNERLHYIDWLRVSAFVILIFYHSAVGFFPNDFWLISSPHTSPTLELMLEHTRVWRLPLLFFVSGVGTYFAFRRHLDFDFLTMRLVRLLIPLLFAMTVICVPQVWYERMLMDGYRGGLTEFWIERYFTEGKYPSGHFTWAHMWFVGYLITITTVFYPIMKLIETSFGKRLSNLFRGVLKTRGLYLLFLIPLLFNLALSPWFPKATNALYNDLAWFAAYTSWFGLGYLVAQNHDLFIENLMKRKREVFSLTIFLSIVAYTVFWLDSFNLNIGDFTNQTSIYKTVTMCLALMMIYSVSALMYQFLNFKNDLISYANKSIFTLYIVHQTIIVGLLYYAIKLELNFVASFIVVVFGTAILSVLFYHLIVRPSAIIGTFFGMGLPFSFGRKKAEI